MPVYAKSAILIFKKLEKNIKFVCLHFYDTYWKYNARTSTWPVSTAGYGVTSINQRVRDPSNS